MIKYFNIRLYKIKHKIRTHYEFYPYLVYLNLHWAFFLVACELTKVVKIGLIGSLLMNTASTHHGRKGVIDKQLVQKLTKQYLRNNS